MAPPAYREIIHIDMDAFYTSIEQRDDTRLLDQPVVVGGPAATRGVVAAASYEARSFGVHSAMPMKRALLLCPRAIRLDPDFSKYRKVSGQLHSIFANYTDLIEPIALDEAYLDVTDNMMKLPSGDRVAHLIRSDIRRQLNLTASAGVGPNKFVAKIASTLRKPDGMVVVTPHEAEKFLTVLPVDKIPGVGRVSQNRLRENNVQTIGQLAALDPTVLTSLFGRRGEFLSRLAHGDDDSPVKAHQDPKQISRETTFATDLYDVREMRQALRELADELGGKAERRRLKGRSVTLKARYPDFRTITRSHSLPYPVDRPTTILSHALKLLDRTDATIRGVRLLGVGLSCLSTEGSEQLELFNFIPGIPIKLGKNQEPQGPSTSTQFRRRPNIS